MQRTYAAQGFSGDLNAAHILFELRLRLQELLKKTLFSRKETLYSTKLYILSKYLYSLTCPVRGVHVKRTFVTKLYTTKSPYILED